MKEETKPEIKQENQNIQSNEQKKENPASEKIDISLIPEMSAEEIDEFLKAQDPEFMSEIEKIGADKSLTIESILIDDETAALHAEIDLWRSYTGFRKILFKVIPFIPRISLKIKFLNFKAKAIVHGYLIRFKNFSVYLLTEGRKNAIEYIKVSLAKIIENVKITLANFKKLTLKTKLKFLSAILMAIGMGLVAYLVFKNKLIPKEKEMFITGFVTHNSKIYEYDPRTEIEPYINNPRAAQNLILFQKMVVNLKPSEKSSRNPMVAFEIFIEGMSSDVVIEVKDREPFFKDLIQRTVEELTFDQLDTEEGKKEMVFQIQKNITNELTTGSVRSVRFKTLVIKK